MRLEQRSWIGAHNLSRRTPTNAKPMGPVLCTLLEISKRGRLQQMQVHFVGGFQPTVGALLEMQGFCWVRGPNEGTGATFRTGVV